VRLYTACADGCRVLTVNEDSEQEAMVVLTTLLGDVDGMRVRAASVAECLAWNASAMTATREQRTEAPPACPATGLPLAYAASPKRPRVA
jgi:hypothetical protein